MAGIYVCEDVAAADRLVRTLFRDVAPRTVRERIARHAQGLREAHANGDTVAAVHLKNWHPDFVGSGTNEIMSASLTIDDTKHCLAREYGFADWNDVEHRGHVVPDEAFESAVDDLVTGNESALRQRLDKSPGLVTLRSSYGHAATLLHYVGSNGVETHRQKVPANLPAITRLLLDRGADANAVASMYGGNTTTLSLLRTSAHPKDAGVFEATERVLLDADTEDRG